MKNLPDFEHEKKLWKKDFLVIGVDEVGRGCLAGPVCVGAVCFDNPCEIKRIKEIEQSGINDSKKLTEKRREELAKYIKKRAHFFAIAKVSSTIINQKGIVQATEIAVRKAIKNIMYKVYSTEYKKNTKYKILDTRYYLLADAFYIKYIKGIGLRNQKAIIHGDEKSISIAAASIIAKVYRDKLMQNLSRNHPNYNWHKNKGYGTADHIQALKEHGKTKYHRNLFIRNIVNNKSKI